eukprot:scaffold143538_cov23-Tisochrysis_lutea.AAC.1
MGLLRMRPSKGWCSGRQTCRRLSALEMWNSEQASSRSAAFCWPMGGSINTCSVCQGPAAQPESAM